MYDVIIVGCGPTGALLAAELRLHRVRVLVLERETEPVAAVRIVGLHIRSLELLAMRGLLDRLLPHGRKRPAATYFAGIDRPAPADLESPYAFLLGIPQPAVVRVLEDHATTLGAHIRHGATVTALDQNDEGVTVHLDSGEHLRSRYLVACDGAHSTVRKSLGIAFPGEPAQNDTLMGELAAAAPPEEIAARLADTPQRLTFAPAGGTTYRVIIPTTDVSTRADPPTLHDFRQALRALTGTDFGIHSPRWLSRFGDATRQAERYRVNRVLLAGDAAHIHPPIGGQGLNLGLQDAFNLGWKLAAQVNGWAPPTLLDTYHSERHPVAADVLDNTRAQTALLAPTAGARAARKLLTELLAYEDVTRHLVQKITALDIRYDFAEAPDLLGCRLPDLPTRHGNLYSQLHRARPLLLDTTGRLTTAAWSNRVDHLSDPTAPIPAPSLLIRPDGHIAWLGHTQQALDTALTRWFGTPTPTPGT